MSTDFYTFPIKLTTLSPLHIGNGESMSSAGEYLCTSDNIHFLQQEALIEKLKEFNHFDDYIQKILDHEKGFDFFKILSKWDINVSDLKKRTIKLHQDGLNPAANNMLHLCIKTNDLAYVPGSSIKGVFRTAIIVKYLKDNPQILKAIESEVLEILERTNSLYALKKYWEKREMEWSGKKKKRNEVEGIVPEKVFQSIRPYDSECVEDNGLVIEQVNRQALYGENTQNSDGLDWLMECIQAEKDLQFELTFHPEFENQNFTFLKKPNINDFFGCINDYTSLLISQEKKLIEASGGIPAIKERLLTQLEGYETAISNSENQYAIARMGKGKTLFFQTVLPLLKDEVRETILHLLKKEPGEFPRSRVLTVKDRLMMGWVKLEMKKPEKKRFDNHVKGETSIGTTLKATYIDLKKVEFVINGELHENIQLINKYKQEFVYGELISTVVHQISKDGRIIQVKLNESS